jgi:hypothetical protein
VANALKVIAVQTVLYVSPMTTGDEVEIRKIHERFPVETLEAGIGVERLLAFIGSGIYALEITVADGDFQEQFHRFLTAPPIREFFRELGRHIEAVPLAEQTTAEMPLATAMMLWQRTGERDATSV